MKRYHLAWLPAGSAQQQTMLEHLTGEYVKYEDTIDPDFTRSLENELRKERQRNIDLLERIAEMQASHHKQITKIYEDSTKLVTDFVQTTIANMTASAFARAAK